MNYIRIYNEIIENARKRNLRIDIERHHVIPKCLNGSNDESNMVNLTYREHFLAHWLLVKIHPSNHKLMYAFNSFCQSNENSGRKFTSHLYEYARRRFVSYMKNAATLNPEFHQKRITSSIEKIWINNGVENKRVFQSEIPEYENQGYKKGRITFKRKNDPSQYKKASETYKEKYKNGYENPGKGSQPLKQFFCQNCQKSYTRGNYIQWHGEKCKYTEDDLISEKYPAKLKDKIWINDGNFNKRVSPAAFESHYKDKGWITGFKKGPKPLD